MKILHHFLLMGMIWQQLILGECEWRKWKTDRRPKVHHSAITMRFLSPKRIHVQKMIVDIHDHFRARVDPPAGNMLKMRWDRRAAKAAQVWANKCLVLEHDSPQGRWTDDFGSCGQNIFIATHKVPWMFAIKTWWLEKDLFHYGPNASNDLSLVGHYTQLVWAPTHRVGCGLNACEMLQNGRRISYFTYICNYCPIGNFADRLGTPYEKGDQCHGCPGHCSGGGGRNRRKSTEISRHPLAVLPRRKHKKKKKNLRPSIIKKQFCLNACPVADLWSNCRELVDRWPQWMCQTKQHNSTKVDDLEAYQRFVNCKASCTCQGLIRN